MLTHGRGSRYAEAFDIDWDFGGGKVRVPILGGRSRRRSPTCGGAPAIAAPTGCCAPHGVVVRYYEHVLPLAPGTRSVGRGARRPRIGPSRSSPRSTGEPIFWRREAAELNYRRFFAVTTLAGVRVEIPWVFDESHAEVLRWVREGLADGLRIDHPDGLADPGGYLERLAAATGGAYVLVEKILEHGEQLPAWWETDGTTGYDALAEIDRVLVDPAGEAALDSLDARLRGRPPRRTTTTSSTTRSGRSPTRSSAPRSRRLVRALRRSVPRRCPRRGRRDAFAELLALLPGVPLVSAGRPRASASRPPREASARRPDLAGDDRLARAGAGRSVARGRPPLPADDRPGDGQGRGGHRVLPVRRGWARSPRWAATRRCSRCRSTEFHAAQAARQASWPHAMTTLSTHDTKRGEDVRARLAVLSEVPERWAAVLAELRERASTGHGPFDSLLYQAVIGAWPASRERLHAYAEKAAREAGEATGWWDPDAAFEARLHATSTRSSTIPRCTRSLDAFVAEIEGAGWSNALSAKLLQLTGARRSRRLPGVASCGRPRSSTPTTAAPSTSRSDGGCCDPSTPASPQGALPAVDATGAAKLLVTSRALRLRRDRAGPVHALHADDGRWARHPITRSRSTAAARSTVATRLPRRPATARGGWGDTLLLRHARRDDRCPHRARASTDRRSRWASCSTTYPVALLVAEGGGLS